MFKKNSGKGKRQYCEWLACSENTKKWNGWQKLKQHKATQKSAKLTSESALEIAKHEERTHRNNL